MLNFVKKSSQYIIVCLALCAVTACTTMVPVNTTPTAIAANVAPGDEIRLVSNGKKYAFKVQKVTQYKIIGPKESIPISSITTLEKKKIDTTKTAVTAGAAAGGITIGAIIAGIVVFGSGLIIFL